MAASFFCLSAAASSCFSLSVLVSSGAGVSSAVVGAASSFLSFGALPEAIACASAAASLLSSSNALRALDSSLYLSVNSIILVFRSAFLDGSSSIPEVLLMI